MSGGFFRGTSADQDTRFSNKQAKLLKSQKFAPELENLVDMTKVKMDVMRPWIATRVTELIGFEDEVLINFIYGLLDGKEVNGKEVQISLTGFMERNTGKFMKELWLLLLSAQKNASGVPQQFLDAKEEETRKKKDESERIANEIRRKKENEIRELGQEGTKKMDRGNDILKDADTGAHPTSKRQPGTMFTGEKESVERNGLQGRRRASRSPHSADRSPSTRERRSRSTSKSFSNSRSYSGERRRSRSLSASPRRRGRSSSSEMVYRSSPRQSLTPPGRRSFRRSFTPSRRRSSYSRRRSSSRPRRRSPSPIRYRMRSPLRRRSRSPLWRRSRSPIWRRPRSPTRRSSPRGRSRSPSRHRPSSVRRRSPSPIRRNSPSSAGYGSPPLMRGKYRRSSSTPPRRPPSPVLRRSRSPIRRRSPLPSRRRSPSPIRHRSPSPVRYRSPSPVRYRSPSALHRVLSSPVGRRPLMGRRRSPTPASHKSDSPQVSSSPSPHHRTPSPVRRKSPRRQRRSPLQSPRGRMRSREMYSPVHHAAPRNTVEHPTNDRHRSNSSERQSQSVSSDRNNSQRKVRRLSPSPHRSPASEADREPSLSEKRRENKSQGHQKKPAQQDSQMMKDAMHSDKGKQSSVGERHRAVEKNQSYSDDTKINDQHLEAAPKLSRKIEHNDQSASLGSDSEESDRIRAKVKDKRKKKRAERRGLESASESSYDSYEEERKEAKRKRKEEKKLKKEDRRRRREERRRRKDERRAEKHKLKSKDAISSPSDADRNHGGHSDYDQSDKKKLEIELREKALESLRAKKGIGH